MFGLKNHQELWRGQNYMKYHLYKIQIVFCKFEQLENSKKYSKISIWTKFGEALAIYIFFWTLICFRLVLVRIKNRIDFSDLWKLILMWFMIFFSFSPASPTKKFGQVIVHNLSSTWFHSVSHLSMFHFY